MDSIEGNKENTVHETTEWSSGIFETKHAQRSDTGSSKLMSLQSKSWDAQTKPVGDKTSQSETNWHNEGREMISKSCSPLVLFITLVLFDLGALLPDERGDILDTFFVRIADQDHSEIFSTLDIDKTADINWLVGNKLN